MNIDDQCKHNLTSFSNAISLADAKAAVLLTAVVAVVGGSYAALADVIQMLARYHRANLMTLVIFLEILLLIELLAFSIAVYYLIQALVPRLDPAAQRQSFFFFGSVARFSNVEKFREFAIGLDCDSLRSQAMDQVYSLAVILQRKYSHIRNAIVALSLGVLISLILSSAGVISKSLSPMEPQPVRLVNEQVSLPFPGQQPKIP